MSVDYLLYFVRYFCTEEANLPELLQSFRPLLMQLVQVLLFKKRGKSLYYFSYYFILSEQVQKCSERRDSHVNTTGGGPAGQFYRPVRAVTPACSQGNPY